MKKVLTVLCLVLSLCIALSCAALAETREAEYLNVKYDIPEFDAQVDLASFNAALAALNAPPVEAETLTLADAVVGAIRLAGMEELALSYIHDDVPRKAANVLAEEGVSVADEYAPYVACALDLDLVDDDADFAAAPTGREAAEMLYRAAEIAGKARRYVGRVDDDDILPRLNAVLSTLIIFDDEELTNLGTEIVLRGAATGYNLKYDNYDANFLPKYTLKYGHSDLSHALQLVALLDSEGFDAYIQIEPKVSVYEYMIEWGEPGEPTPTYAVHQVSDDRYLAYAVEYDMLLEFDTVKEKEAFHNLVETYAKVYDDSYDADGNRTEKLIAGSWWQPLYSSTTAMQNEEFAEMVDNVVHCAEGYSIHPFSLPEGTQAVADVVAEVEPELSVDPQTIYVNPAFYRYTLGTDHQ